MMLAEAGICGNRRVADGGPLLGLGFSASVYVGEGSGGVLDRAHFFERYPWPDRLLKAI